MSLTEEAKRIAKDTRRNDVLNELARVVGKIDILAAHYQKKLYEITELRYKLDGIGDDLDKAEKFISEYHEKKLY
jgi:hypothetical protein